MSALLFVYGTLMPGQPRWPILSSLVTSEPPRPAETPGRLYRTPYGWPAAVFDDRAEARVPGLVLGLKDADAALPVLDTVEGVASGLFDRRSVETVSGPCWAYHWPGAIDGFSPIVDWLHTPDTTR